MESFCGILNLLGAEDQVFDSHFSVNNNIVSVIPLTVPAKDKLYELSYNTYEYQDKYHNWFYGFSETNCAVAFLQIAPMQPKRVSFPGINLHAHCFATPIIVTATDHTVTDVSTFDVIEFYGGIVDTVHDCALAVGIDHNHGIRYTKPESYTQKYEGVEIDGEKFNIIASIVVPRSTTIEIPDIKAETHSILRFEFERPQPLDKVSQFYNYAMKLFQFCTGRLNLRTNIRLYQIGSGYQTGSHRPILVEYKDGYFDYAVINPRNVIRLNFLADKFVSLFKLLNSKKEAPYMEFLPQANKYLNAILYTNVTDLCVAFEREYGLQKFPKDEECKKAAEKLTDDILKFINDQKDSLPDPVTKKAASILNSQLKGFSPATQEKITAIYEKYCGYMKRITEPEGHDVLGITKFYSKEKFEELIKDFVKIRNKASHAGVIWNEGKDIFDHLKLLIYFSVLGRAGFTPSESASILSYLFAF